jgi:hypothetical protein
LLKDKLKQLSKRLFGKLVSSQRRKEGINPLKEQSTIQEPPTMSFDQEQPRINKPIFIVGCGRSGTTLLFQLLKQHPQLVGTSGYPDGEDHVGWIKHGNCMISGFGHPDVNAGQTGFHCCLHMDEKDVTPKIIENMVSYYYHDVLQEDTTKRVINKCPHLSNKLKYVKAIFPDAKFIHIIRDCLPVVFSWIKVMEDVHSNLIFYWPYTKYPCFWVMPVPEFDTIKTIFEKEPRIYQENDGELFVDYWSTVNRNISIQLQDSADQLLIIKYEELTANPLKTLNHICEFCELEQFYDVSIQIHSNNNEKYKKKLSEKQIKKFLEKSYSTRLHFGYSE